MSPTLYLNSYRNRVCLIYCSLTINLFECCKTSSDKIITIIIALFGLLFGEFMTWNGIINSNAILIVAYIMLSLLLISGLIRSIIFFLGVIKQYDEVMTSTSRKITFVYVFLGDFYLVAIYVIWFCFGMKPWQDITANELIAYTLLDIFVAVVCVNLPSRITRRESAVYKVIFF